MNTPDWTLRRLSDWSYVVEHMDEETSFRTLDEALQDIKSTEERYKRVREKRANPEWAGKELHGRESGPVESTT